MKTKLFCFYSFIAYLTIIGCEPNYHEGTFGYDLNALRKVASVEVLKNGEAMIAVSGDYQARVFVSSATGLAGKSLGWFNHDLIKGEPDEMLSRLGGESRMWFGPEAGKYSIFFEPGVAQLPENMTISPDLNQVTFKVTDRCGSQLVSSGEMQIRNANGYTFYLNVERKISLLNKSEIERSLNVDLPKNLAVVAFSTETEIENIGQEQWTKANGLLAIWDLGCMQPTPETWVILPTRGTINRVTPYFTEITPDRIRILDSIVFYKADAKYLNKIGIPPSFCKDIFGSYSPELKLLNIVKFNFENDSLYVNSQWGNEAPYDGDVINVFNGEVNKPLDRNWPFYELETSSSAKELFPGEKMIHKQSIYHFYGDKEQLNELAKSVLGVRLELPDNLVKPGDHQ